MSWGLSVHGVPGTELEKELYAAQELYEENPPQGYDKTQAEEAIFSAIDLISTGVVGDPMKHSFSVSLSGHANPDHEPADGWANDAITISVYQD